MQPRVAILNMEMYELCIKWWIDLMSRLDAGPIFSFGPNFFSWWSE